MFSSTSVFNSAPNDGHGDGKVQTFLIGEDTRWEFLFNPEKLGQGKEARYNPVPAHGITVPELNYGYTSGITITLPDLLLTGYCRGKSYLPVITALTDLLNVKDGKYRPETVDFLMGKRRIGPAVITDVQPIETGWTHSGNPSDARISITLLTVRQSRKTDSLPGIPQIK
ncbi:hypothetical protein [Kamptonema sp. UHCC 0994]|uniref:hypothetical protein n=1 Tax=Kamptonema sp. UHCC 0994 TaxID=3031329 RepID=UPI0023B9BC6C|nr:hypothetical protein [Kamptonema sp. UHCC 0994]MDF0554905.1 hypothetical protein [Kamptonema sp. UHCC 0994]